MEDRKRDHTYTQNIVRKDRKKDHTYSKGNSNIRNTQNLQENLEPAPVPRQNSPSTIQPILQVTEVNQYIEVNECKPKPDHSYSVMDKPKFAHREKHENKVDLPYPLKGDHEYVRGNPETNEAIVSETL